jgi:hypothetical protein
MKNKLHITDFTKDFVDRINCFESEERYNERKIIAENDPRTKLLIEQIKQEITDTYNKALADFWGDYINLKSISASGRWVDAKKVAKHMIKLLNTFMKR